MSAQPFKPNPELDLVLDRTIDVPVEKVWRAWTIPANVMKWFTPKPWETVECEIDLRPGGMFRTVMRSPEGQLFPNLGCYLEVVPNRKLIWTAALEPGYRPAASKSPGEGKECDDLMMTAIVLMEPTSAGGTHYTAIALHKNTADRARHEAMGFYDGWGTVLNQLVAIADQF